MRSTTRDMDWTVAGGGGCIGIKANDPSKLILNLDKYAREQNKMGDQGEKPEGSARRHSRNQQTTWASQNHMTVLKSGEGRRRGEKREWLTVVGLESSRVRRGGVRLKVYLIIGERHNDMSHAHRAITRKTNYLSHTTHEQIRLVAAQRDTDVGQRRVPGHSCNVHLPKMTVVIFLAAVVKRLLEKTTKNSFHPCSPTPGGPVDYKEYHYENRDRYQQPPRGDDKDRYHQPNSSQPPWPTSYLSYLYDRNTSHQSVDGVGSSASSGSSGDAATSPSSPPTRVDIQGGEEDRDLEYSTIHYEPSPALILKVSRVSSTLPRRWLDTDGWSLKVKVPRTVFREFRHVPSASVGANKKARGLCRRKKKGGKGGIIFGL
uniref:Uncharacterized protein n=1 Tax=Timema genevievae TaxID=629358 RepID=A0A7R9PJI6_TIMGE|nr:unnamed protein product [Timema genevievae]